MIKKWRPFWSYDPEKTEEWLAEMAAEGKQLISMNKMSRNFLFENGPAEEVSFQIVYHTSGPNPVKTLRKYGWRSVLSEGHWEIMKNPEEKIRVYPARDELYKRNRLHTVVLSCLSFVYAFQLIGPLLILYLLLTGESFEVSVEASPYWSLTVLYFSQVVAVFVLTIYLNLKIRASNRKYFSSAEDEIIPMGRTFSKTRFAWREEPDKTEQWLEEMAKKGNQLIKVTGNVFKFEKGTPHDVIYTYDAQWNAAPNYYEIHKSAGWQLKMKNTFLFSKTALWMQTYEDGSERPEFTYDSREKWKQVKKVVTKSFLVEGLYLILFSSIGWMLWRTVERGFNFQTILFILLAVSLLLPLVQLMKSVRYLQRMRQNYK